MKILHIGNLKSGIDNYVRNTVALAGSDLTILYSTELMTTVNPICDMVNR